MFTMIIRGNDIVEIIVDEHMVSLLPVERAPIIVSASQALDLLNVSVAHSMGYTGKGRLACTFDVGVDGSHPQFASRWRGLNHPANQCWISTAAVHDSVPTDKYGHGTHTMGILVGKDFGVAPDAQWISAGIIDQGYDGNTTISQLIQAFQWAMNPDGDINTTDDMPDVISNSWGFPMNALPTCAPVFENMLLSVEATGISVIFAAGNEGTYGAASLRDPADNAFAVGCINGDKSIAGFSSRGPSRCTGHIKPDVVAPGVSIYSSYKDGTYAYMSGTSMSAPFIAGLVVLARQYNPKATPQQIKDAIINSCEDLGATGPDNIFGYGLPDVIKMLSYLGDTTPVEPPHVDTLYVDSVATYPNPVATTLTIGIQVRVRTSVDIQVFDVLGREVDRFSIDAYKNVVAHWDSQKHSSGVYFIRVVIGDKVFNKKVLVLH